MVGELLTVTVAEAAGKAPMVIELLTVTVAEVAGKLVICTEAEAEGKVTVGLLTMVTLDEP